MVIPDVKPPVWLRIDRIGMQIAAAYSKDGKQWTPAGMASFASGMPYGLGFMVMSGSYTEMAKVAVDNVVLGAP
jgi:regulation of enolase protein 1 (concanavalin A-like superfamily)